jgi:hypothetical protein
MTTHAAAKMAAATRPITQFENRILSPDFRRQIRPFAGYGQVPSSDEISLFPTVFQEPSLIT